MHDVTKILRKIESGNRQAADELLPIVYDALRRLAASRMQTESPDHTLQPTALVHEAYVRLVKPEDAPSWESRGHFFAAAAEAMRRILVDHARSKMTLKRGGDFQRIDLLEVVQDGKIGDAELLVLDEALREFEGLEPEKARIVKLKFFAGMTLNDAAESIGISRATAQRHWTYARAWLYGKLKESYDGEDSSEFPENH